MSTIMEGVAYFPSGKEIGRIGIIVDDMLITVPRNNPRLAEQHGGYDLIQGIGRSTSRKVHIDN
jgi:hypothetical protein